MSSQTERLLDTLDQPDTPIRAVVSVNKLKEGWDVKNIAVMVSLRAMESDVLTQQTMGRGLRLPFGKWVDDPAINELDIVAHESFRKLLDAENVLRSFGLADAVPPADDADQVVAYIQGADLADGNEIITSTDPTAQPSTTSVYGDDTKRPPTSPSEAAAVSRHGRSVTTILATSHRPQSLSSERKSR